jgi:hypothetical protein
MSKPRLLHFFQGLLAYPIHKTIQPESGLLGIFSPHFSPLPRLLFFGKEIALGNRGS